MRDLKDRLLDDEISLYAWLPTEHMLSDALTKEMKMHEGLEDVLAGNGFSLPDVGINEVKCIDGELRMSNIRNRNKET